jgi:cyclophilin family peptidyl-prolyl cis-trans isomerase
MTKRRRGYDRSAGAPRGTPPRVSRSRTPVGDAKPAREASGPTLRRPGGRSSTSSWPLLIAGGALVLAAVAAFLGPLGGRLPFGIGSAPTGAAQPTDVASGVPDGCPTSQPPALAAGETRDVAISTSQGDFTIRVHGDWSPIAAGNFVALAECGFYDGVTFHRLVPGFVIQGGDPDGTGSGGPPYRIADEPVTQAYRRGVVAMARTPAPNSQGSQFFVVLDDQARGSLERANTYAIFGEVVDGMNTVDAIAAMPNSGPPDNRALQPVAMTSVIVASP